MGSVYQKNNIQSKVTEKREIEMGLQDGVKFIYLKKLRFLLKRQTIRMMKVGLGMTAVSGTAMWFMYQVREGINEIHVNRKMGEDSIVAAAILGRVSGMGENKLSEGKSLAQMVADVEARAAVPYENIRTPRPWEMDTVESKKKYLKRAYKELETKIDDRATNRSSEEERIQNEIRLIRAKSGANIAETSS